MVLSIYSRDVVFGLGTYYGTGVCSSVAVNKKGKIVEVHKTENPAGTQLWYQVGAAKQMHATWSTAKPYDTGRYPSVAINDNDVVVEVHQSGSLLWPLKDKLWYNVGKISGNSIVDWDEDIAEKYDSGQTPSIALDNSNWCVEVHKEPGEDDDDNRLWYRVGKVNVNSKSIDWKKYDGDKSHPYDWGFYPQVALNNKGIVMEVHEVPVGEASQIHYKVGKLNKGENRVEWNWNATAVTMGYSPSVAIADDGFVVITYSREGILYKRVGVIEVEGNSLFQSWYLDEPDFDTGNGPSVAVAFDASLAIQTHQNAYSKDHPFGLWFSTSLIGNRKKWMEEQYDILRTKKLSQVTLPGSHDCGAYDMEETRSGCPGGVPYDFIDGEYIKPFAQTHNLTLARQLAQGARYFDLRPYLKLESDGTFAFYAYHDLICANIAVMLDELASFLASTNHELVILNLNHFCFHSDEFPAFKHQDLINLIINKVGEYLFTDMSVDLTKITIEQFVGDGVSKVIVLYEYKNDTDYYLSLLPAGFWANKSESNANSMSHYVYDCYSDTDDYSTMMGNQLGKMKNNSGTCKLFLLSWTLTFQDNPGSILKGMLCIDIPILGVSGLGPGLRCMVRDANRNLGKFLSENVHNSSNQYKINVLYVDYLRDARVTDCAILLNKILHTADLSVVTTASPATIYLGQQVTYTITVSNNGPGNATCVELTDVIQGDVFIETVPAGCTCTGNRNTWIIGGLAAGESKEFTFIVTPTFPGTIFNIASVEGDQEDPDPDNNTVKVATNILPVADLAVYKNTFTTEAKVGEPLPYLYTVINNGPSAAIGVTLSDTFSGDIHDLDIVLLESPGSCSPVSNEAFTCQLSSLVPREVTYLTAEVIPGEVGSLLNTVQVASDIHDPVSENNKSDLIITVEPRADLAVVKTVTPQIGVLGQEIQYHITVTNNGPSEATGIIVEDTLPSSGLIVLSVSPNVPVYGNMVTWTYPSLAKGASETMTITVIPTQPGVITNTSSIAANETDSNPCNNSSITQAFVRSVVETDLAVTMSHSPENVKVCKLLTFTVVVTNNGPEAATGVILYDQIPSSMEILSVKPSSGYCCGDYETQQDKCECTAEYRCFENIYCDDDGHKEMGQQLQEIACHLGSLVVGANATVEIVVRPKKKGDSINTAFVTANQTELNTGDNMSIDTVSIS